MKYPNKLNKDDTIKIISPSDGVIKKKINKLESAIKFLSENDLIVNEGKYVRSSHDGVSTTATNRADELNMAISDQNIKALIACSGGDYLIQILNLIDFEKILTNPKWFQGHSDITSLLYYITTKYDLATIYNFNVKTYGDKNMPKSMLQNSISFLKNEPVIQKEYGYRISDEIIPCNWKCINDFRPIKGRIIGGCLESLKDIIGTKYDNTKEFINKYQEDGIVWYFDVYSMPNEDILRTMWQLKSCGWFEHCKGILFGRLYEEKNYTNITLKESINYCLKDLNVPIIIDVDLGHTDPVITIVNGSLVNIEYNEKFEITTILK